MKTSTFNHWLSMLMSDNKEQQQAAEHAGYMFLQCTDKQHEKLYQTLFTKFHHDVTTGNIILNCGFQIKPPVKR